MSLTDERLREFELRPTAPRWSGTYCETQAMASELLQLRAKVADLETALRLARDLAGEARHD